MAATELLGQIANSARQLVSTEASQLDSSLRAAVQLSGVPRPAAGGQPRRGLVTERQLVLGVISNQRTPKTREWIRSTYMGEAASLEGVLLRFVIGRHGLNQDDKKRLRSERREHGDLELIAASDFAQAGGIFSCIDKLFEWFPHAVRTYPGAAFYGKADDDSLVDVRRLVEMLQPVASLPNVYAGYVQYDSFIRDEWKHCGWGASPVGAAHGHTAACPAGRASGPFPFVVGALTLMGADLASWFEGSSMVKDFVARGRASQKEAKHWDCGYSDVTLGHVLAEEGRRANLSISLVSFRDALRDATYGAMKAERFVAAHHLRTEASFRAAHAATRKADRWAAKLHPCTPWHQTSHLATTWRGDPQGGDEDPTRLRTAMRQFESCKTWRMCELQPLPP